MNIESIVKNEFLAPFLPLSGYQNVRIFSHYINIKRIKAQRGTTLSFLLSRRAGIVCCHNRTVGMVYFGFRRGVESINVR